MGIFTISLALQRLFVPVGRRRAALRIHPSGDSGRFEAHDFNSHGTSKVCFLIPNHQTASPMEMRRRMMKKLTTIGTATARKNKQK